MPGAYLWGYDETTGEPVKCKVTADGKLIINPTGFLENPPTEDSANTAPTSEWAFDHDADAAAHHAKYTDAESRSAINDIFDASGIGLKDFNLGYHSFQSLRYCKFRFQASDNAEIAWYKSPSSNILNVSCNKFGVGLQDFVMRFYNGVGWTEVIRDDTFQANLDDFLENPPTEDSANTAPTSEWAFDHDADAAAHHAKYTDADAVWSFYNRKATLTTGTYTAESMTDISMLELDTSGGDITLQGLDDGSYGQMIFCVKPASANDVHIIHNSGAAAAGDKIYTQSAGDESLAAGCYGGFWMIYFGGNWLVGHAVP